MYSPVTPRRPLLWHPSIERLRAIIPSDETVYLVGGAVRDAYLHRPLHDIDLATPGDGRPLARHIANTFKGAYYCLDRARGVGRALIPWESDQLTIDVAQFRGPDLLTDLHLRDFTLNAMAVDLTGDLQSVIDPLNGLGDLDAKRIRQCSPNAISTDPIRALRAVRASVTFKLMIEAHTRDSIKTHAQALTTASPERIRDEFFNLLDGTHPAQALTALHHLGLLAQIIPQTRMLPGVTQSPPHQFDVWQHTLKTIAQLDVILSIMAPHRSGDLTSNIQTGAVATAFDPLRDALREHLAYQWPNGRTHRALLILAALLHDIGKPPTRSIDDAGHIRFLRHEHAGAEIAEERGRALRLSNDEIARLTTIVQHHMRPHWLNVDTPPSRRAIYRFWRDAGPAGVDICLLAAADYLATYGVTLDTVAWIGYLEHLQMLLVTYFHHFDSAITPPPLLNGQQLLNDFGMEPGPQIGEILEQLREAQAVGDITTRKEALEWVQRFLDSSG